MKKLYSVILIWLIWLSCFFATTLPANAGELINFEYNSECTTEGTTWDGARRSCNSTPTSKTVPSDYVYNQNTMSASFVRKNGSSNRCDYTWSDYVEIIPGSGIAMPRTLTYSVHARSPKADFPGDNAGARGWTECSFKGTYTQFR